MRRRSPVPDDFPETLFRAVECQSFGKATCFLCGRRLGSRNRTDEHVFPKWLLHRFNLWNAQLGLLNGTDIPYRMLTIPCCNTCNNDHLGALEARIEQAVAEGPDAVRALPTPDVLVWLGKIMYGMLYKEGFLKRHRSRSRSGRIVPRADLESLSMHHYFLQSVRVPMEFQPKFPGSIQVFRVQSPEPAEFQFDYRDDTTALAVSIRLGEVGILAALQDGGAQDGFSEHFDRYRALPLHPLQFLELTAQFLYKSRLQTRVPKFILHDARDRIVVHQMPLGGLSLAPIFQPWDHEVYARILAMHTGLDFERLYHPSGKVMSWLNDGNGNVPAFDLVAQPWPASVQADNIDARTVELPPDEPPAG
jgi:hypothetical protein